MNTLISPPWLLRTEDSDATMKQFVIIANCLGFHVAMAAWSAGAFEGLGTPTRRTGGLFGSIETPVKDNVQALLEWRYLERCVDYQEVTVRSEEWVHLSMKDRDHYYRTKQLKDGPLCRVGTLMPLGEDSLSTKLAKALRYVRSHVTIEFGEIKDSTLAVATWLSLNRRRVGVEVESYPLEGLRNWVSKSEVSSNQAFALQFARNLEYWQSARTPISEHIAWKMPRQGRAMSDSARITKLRWRCQEDIYDDASITADYVWAVQKMREAMGRSPENVIVPSDKV